MKKYIIFCALLAGTAAAHAQTSDRSSYTPDARSTKSVKTTKSVSHDNKFEAVEMSLNDGSVSFTNLPDLAKQAWAVITDENGDLIKQARASNEDIIDVHKLSKGMYFVSLVYKTKTEKAFILQIE